MTKNILFVTPDISDNSTGRTYALWLLAKHLGWSAKVLSYSGSEMWSPAAGTSFAEAATVVPLKGTRARRGHLKGIVRDFDLVVSVKPLRNSFHVAGPVCRRAGVPHLLDIDDPDLALRLRLKPLARAVLWRIRFLSFWLSIRDSRALSARQHITVSNPELWKEYGGTIIPHARPDRGEGDQHIRKDPHLAFVGTARAHKGIDLLRAAVSQVQSGGVRLTVTDKAPTDAHPWEDWVGTCTMDEGFGIVASSDIVVIPSTDSLHSRGQLPAKLMDAAMLGRGIIVTAVDPLPWAIADAGLVVAPDPVSIARAIRTLSEPSVRVDYGRRARALYLQRYSVEACGHNFRKACEDAMETKPQKSDAKSNLNGPS